MNSIHALVRRAWWRLVVIDVLRTLAVTVTVVAGLLLVWRLVESLVPLPASWSVVLWSGAGVALVWSVVWSIVRVKQGGAVARQIDERAGLHEALSTALCVEPSKDPWSRATVELARREAERVDLARSIPIQTPRLWPAPVAAVAVLAIALVSPMLNLSALLHTEPKVTRDEQAIIEASAEIEQVQKDLQAEAQRLGVELPTDDEAGEDWLKPEQMSAEEIQAAAVKKLTQLTDALEEQMQQKGAAKLESLERSLQRLRQPGPGPAQELARAMARGQFDKARDELSKLAQQIRDGELSKEQKQQLQKQMKNLAQQLDELSKQRKETERALREAGMNSDDAKRLAADPDALQKALDQLEGMSDEQKQQIMKQAMANAQSGQQLNAMSQAMGQMASGMNQDGMSGSMQAAMDSLGDQLSDMEMLAGDTQSLQAIMDSASNSMRSMGSGFCNNPGSGEGEGLGPWRAGDTDHQGNGSGGPGQGNGVSPDAKQTSISLNETHARVNTQAGPIIGSRMVYEGQIRGESRAEFAMSAKSAAHNAEDAIESMRVPRAYEGAVMHFFGAMKDIAEEEAPDAEASDTQSPEGDK